MSAAVVALETWNGDYANEPEGWVRHLGTMRRRPDGDKNKEFVNG